MKKYYISYYRNFANCYTLASVETAEDAAALQELGGTWERITLKVENIK